MTLPLQRSRETVELDVDLERELTCEFEGCSSDAEWLVATRCCNDRAVECSKHVDHLRAFCLRWRMKRCDPCGRPYTTFDEWIRLVRL